jgi:Uma2 family endonuclease
MVNVLPISKPIVTDAWVPATWEEFLVASEDSEYTKAKCYYDLGLMRIETMPTGSGHARDNSTLAAVITLYGALKNLDYASFTNGSFRQSGERECQPDLAYYIGQDFRAMPHNNQSVDVKTLGAPTLAIEISATSLSEDLGDKRLLYERLGVREYWVVNVKAAKMIAFSVENGGSREISSSWVLPGLEMSLIEEALQRNQNQMDSNNGALNRWLIQQFTA